MTDDDNVMSDDLTSGDVPIDDELEEDEDEVAAMDDEETDELAA